MQFFTSIILVLATVFSIVGSLFSFGNTTYYFDSVNGNDLNNGKSEESPYRSLELINGLVLKSGDTVLIRCGSVYRGSLNCKAGVIYKSYGDGEKPTFLGSADASDASCWKEADCDGVWVFSEKQNDDIGNIIFDSGKQNGIKRITGSLDFNGTVSELNNDLEFWHNTKDKRIYLRSDTNPGERFSSIELAKCKHVINVTRNVTLDGLKVLYGGAHGITGKRLAGVTIRNCEIGWVGGSLQPGKGTVRYGNGIEFWSHVKNILVENCEIYQIYDAGLTFQSTGNETYDNIVFRSNHISYCTYSIEYFNGDKGTINNVTIDSNCLEYAGMGWGKQRPDPGWTSHINSWEYNNKATNFVISNNTLNQSTHSLFAIYSKAGTLPELNGNKYIQASNGDLTHGIKFNSEEAENLLGEFDKNAVTETV